VYFATAFFLARRALGRPPLRTWTRILERVSYVLAAIGLVCFYYAFRIEPYWPEITHVTIVSPKVQAPVRFVHIADLHCDGKVRLEKRLPELIRSEHPDLITFAGDTVVNKAGVPLAREVLSQLSDIAPTFVVLGNWDVSSASAWRERVSDPSFFHGTGVLNLLGFGVPVDIRGQHLWIGGASVSQPDLLPRLLGTAPRDRYDIFLYHYPDEVELVKASPVDLYLAGHTHGGQIALPFYGALLTYSKYDKQYVSGLHRIGNAWIYTNRGIGLEGHFPRARFAARPEITVIDLVPASR
jgi:predicted MPP superfamily phosphohydrolase